MSIRKKNPVLRHFPLKNFKNTFQMKLLTYFLLEEHLWQELRPDFRGIMAKNSWALSPISLKPRTYKTGFQIWNPTLDYIKAKQLFHKSLQICMHYA